MSESPGSATKKSTPSDPGPPGGFKSFWKKSDRSAASQNVQFVQQNPGNERKRDKLSRLLKHGSSASTEEGQSEGSDKASAAAKRRQQVYQAQKRHRNRKAEYIQSLEAEIAKLQHLDAVTNSEKNTIAHQNDAIKALLAAHSIDAQFDAMNVASSTSEDLSMLGTAAIDIRYDPEIGHDRVFTDFDDLLDMEWTSSNTSQSGEPLRRTKDTSPAKGDSWAALDFILALEWPCKDHVAHHAINPAANAPDACDAGYFHGHALTTTGAVFQSALPPADTRPEQAKDSSDVVATQGGLHPSTEEHWQLPHSEIDKLVELSERLQLDDEQMTPAQAYSAVRQEVPGDSFVRPVLEALKVPLSSLVRCSGFGAWMPADMFYQHFDGVLQNLKSGRPDLI